MEFEEKWYTPEERSPQAGEYAFLCLEYDYGFGELQEFIKKKHIKETIMAKAERFYGTLIWKTEDGKAIYNIKSNSIKYWTPISIPKPPNGWISGMVLTFEKGGKKESI